MANIAVLFGGPSPEHDISILTGLQAARELTNGGHGVIVLYWSKAGDWYRVPATLEGASFVDGVPREAEKVQLVAETGGGFVVPKKGVFGKGSVIEIDCAVMCGHGGPAEDGSLQGALDLAGIRYTGPTLAGAALGMDKLAFAGIVATAGLPALPRLLVTAESIAPDFPPPYILKPQFGGSSIGIEIVDSIDTAKALLKTSPHLRGGAVIEPYLPESVDLNVAVRLYPEAQVSAIEKPMRSVGSSDILGYADKYVGGEGMVSAPRELPANIPAEQEQELRRIALEVARLVGVRGIQRIDFLSDADKLYVNEINTIPGSLSKHLFVQPDVAFSVLLRDMIAEAGARSSRQWTSAGADGTALRSAGAIDGKLS